MSTVFKDKFSDSSENEFDDDLGPIINKMKHDETPKHNTVRRMRKSKNKIKLNMDEKKQTF